MEGEWTVNHYFVDEAGDLSLFDRHGRSLLGKEGCSKFFIIGVAYLPNPAATEESLSKLREEILADPYFKGVPSMQPAAKKTAIAFHAKDDPPEVRREVFKLLQSFGIKVQAAIRRKGKLLRFARLRHSAAKD